ncbi:MAG: aspartate carbamoyltransferase catalytic subunit [Arenicella sp.]
MSDSELQLDKQGNLQHFLTIDGLSRQHLLDIMDTAELFINRQKNKLKKRKDLKNKTVVNLFFEPSTRTRTTFEIAAKHLGANVINLNVQRMSTTKGETLLDTIHNLEAMHTDMFVIRDTNAGAAYLVAKHVEDEVSVLNAGDGRHAHPTQAMLDMFTIREYKKEFENLSVAIVGDILHSRVARSQINALKILGTKDIRVIGPNTLLPTDIDTLGVQTFNSMQEGLADVDIIMMLRLQRERMEGQLFASEQEYFNVYGLNQDKIQYAKPDALVMHPGPINRGLEISSDIADSSRSLILPQVTNGIAVRMSVMAITANNRSQSS